ncbi:hypothetical protein VIGAN_09140700 [Vigna angularis var. angularis]|uniref:Uncharacterized protein n=1 Tax=Vigna angularis var. angularis TaxID=157739 RepID=A0A0S3SY96_PHAAN|nr:hypothetical protein VIGAN_09140700 [Vigna angularis var. angularis]
MICTNKKKVDFYRKLLDNHLAPGGSSSASKELASTHPTTVNHLFEAVINLGKRKKIRGSMRRSLPSPCLLNTFGARCLLH